MATNPRTSARDKRRAPRPQPAQPTQDAPSPSQPLATLMHQAEQPDAPLQSGDIMALQRQLGNQTVERLLGRHAPGARAATPALQRKLLGPTEAFQQNLELMKAYKQLMQALEQEKTIAQLIDYAEDEKYNTDLVFDVRKEGAPGETQLWIGKREVTAEGDMKRYIDEVGLESLQDARMTVKILVTPSALHAKEEINQRDALQILAHEYAIHAVRFIDYIDNLRAMAGDSEVGDVKKFVDKQSRSGGVSAFRHHHDLVFGLNETYNALVDVLRSGVLEEEDEQAFDESYNKDIKTYAVELYVHQLTSTLGVESVNVDSLMREDLEVIKSKIDLDTILRNYEKSKSQIDDIQDKLANLGRDDLTFSSFRPQKTTGFKKTVPKKSVSSERQPLIEQSESQSKWCCFITTACMRSRGLPDDCEELTVLRRFRDDYMRALPEGELLIATYYDHSPAIVRAIEARADAPAIYERLYRIITICVSSVKGGRLSTALRIYITMVLTLRSAYTPGMRLANERELAAALDRVR